jgi:hypothetical protein
MDQFCLYTMTGMVAKLRAGKLKSHEPNRLQSAGISKDLTPRHDRTVQLDKTQREAPFSPAVWQSIWDGTVQF